MGSSLICISRNIQEYLRNIKIFYQFYRIGFYSRRIISIHNFSGFAIFRDIEITTTCYLNDSLAVIFCYACIQEENVNESRVCPVCENEIIEDAK